MSANLLLPIDGSATEAGPWWHRAPALSGQAIGRSHDALCASYRFGDVIVDLDTTYEPLLEEFGDACGDCAVPDSVSDVVSRLRCSARIIKGLSLVALRFQIPEGLPHLCDIASWVIRPRTELQHLTALDLDLPDWRLIANARDERLPLLAADAHNAIVDVRIAPAEFLTNLIVGIAQLAQPSVLFVHAGAVAIDGRGTLLVGGSGKGKSTTTVTLAGRGHALLGDETVGLRANPPEILSFRRTVKLRQGPRSEAVKARLDAVSHGTIIDAEGVECDWIKPSALFPDPAPLQSVPFTDVFFLRRFTDQTAIEPFVPSLDHLEELQALTMTLSAVVSWPPSAAPRLMRYFRVINLFAKCRCYFLDLGTPDETAALIERTVRNNA